MKPTASIIAILLGQITFACWGLDFQVKVTNDSPYERKGEICEVGGSLLPEGLDAAAITVRDEAGRNVACQLTHDGSLLFPVWIGPGKSKNYKVSTGGGAPADTICYGRIFPERLDDIAWENDRAAYRAYGPALQATGEKAYGYDVWTKSVPFPVLEKRYYGALKQGISFHKDHGEGMDVYAVGPSLGGGTTALLDASGNIIMPYCWREARVLDNGPLRFTAELVFEPKVVGNDTITEYRTIRLDAGEWLNQTDVYYQGAPEGQKFIAGAVVHHSNPDAYCILPEYHAVTYEDLTQEPAGDNGIIYLGLIGPDDASQRYIPSGKEREVAGHISLEMNCGKTPVRYYWGGAWSKGGMPTIDDWQGYLIDFTNRKKHPLGVNVECRM